MDKKGIKKSVKIGAVALASATCGLLCIDKIKVKPQYPINYKKENVCTQRPDPEYERSRRIYGKRVPLRYVQYQVDTIQSTASGGYYNYYKKNIRVHYVAGKDKFNRFSHGDALLVHEAQHEHNVKIGIHAYAVSPEQAYRLVMHDEITANIASLLALRQRYLNEKNLNIFKTEYFGFYDYYGKAIKDGIIHPESNSVEEFDKEMEFILKATTHQWMKEFYDDYQEKSLSFIGKASDVRGDYARFHDKNYKKTLGLIYNIGGVDFMRYFKDDFKIQSADKIQIQKKTEEVKSRAELYTNADYAEKYDFPKYDGKISLQEYENYLRHIAVLREIKDNNSEELDNFAVGMEILNNPKSSALKKKYAQKYIHDFQVIYDNTKRDCLYEDEVEKMVKSATLEQYMSGLEFVESNENLYKSKINHIMTVKAFGGGKVNLMHGLADYTFKFKKKRSFETTILMNNNYITMPDRAQEKIYSLRTKTSSSYNRNINERVSEVIGRWIPDMSKNVVTNPHNTYVQSQKNNKSLEIEYFAQATR